MAFRSWTDPDAEILRLFAQQHVNLWFKSTDSTRSTSVINVSSVFIWDFCNKKEPDLCCGWEAEPHRQLLGVWLTVRRAKHHLPRRDHHAVAEALGFSDGHGGRLTAILQEYELPGGGSCLLSLQRIHNKLQQSHSFLLKTQENRLVNEQQMA